MNTPFGFSLSALLLLAGVGLASLLFAWLSSWRTRRAVYLDGFRLAVMGRSIEGAEIARLDQAQRLRFREGYWAGRRARGHG